MENRNNGLRWVALTLVILGAINWGLVGLFKFDLIATLFGGMEGIISRILYTLVMLAGLYCISFYHRANEETHDRIVTRDNDAVIRGAGVSGL